MRVFLAAVLAGILCLPKLSAQDLRADLYAPFVSHLDAQSNGAEVVLSWQDAPGGDDFLYEIRRYPSPIDASSLQQAERLVTIAPGIQIYTDRPDEGVDWWYAVVAVGPDGAYEMMIPWRNTLGAPVRIDSGIGSLENAVRIQALDATVSGATVFLDYTVDGENGEIVLIRSPRPFNAAASIDHAVEIGRSSASSGTVEDRPISGVDWYYAAMDAGLFDNANTRWMDAAAIAGPVRPDAPGSGFAAPTNMRPAPLPILRIDRSMTSGADIQGIDGVLPDRRPMESAAIRVVAGILGPMQGRPWIPPEPEILEMDLAPTDNRRQQILTGILEGSFAEEDWSGAESELFALAAANGLDRATRSRIMFYRGQCQYFQNRLRAAFLSFLAASADYYPESRRWMVRVYDDITPVG